ncbi:MAG: CoA transferase [Myxococcales bacterium]|nr:CoA transferase [Myxococcales bacterium]
MSDNGRSTRILEGVRVLDMTQYLAGAGVTRMMAELGADITKIEIAPVGDPGRLLPVVKTERSGFFVQHNRGKNSLCLDWSKPEALSIIKELAAQSDIFCENFGRGGILAKRGLDYESIKAVKRDIIYLTVSVFGRKSPWSEKPGYDYVAQAASGIMHMTGEPDRPPGMVWSALGDTNAAVHGFGSLGYALYHRERTGEGQYIDLAMADCLFHFHEGALEAHHLTDGAYVPKRFGAHHQLVFPAGTFKSPGGYIVLLALELQWKNVCECIDRLDLLTDPRSKTMEARAENRLELAALIEQWMATFDNDAAILEQLEKFHVPAAPVLSPIDALDHPHYKARDMVRWVKDPILGEIPIPGFPWKFSAQPDLPDIQAPLLGEHNAQVLSERLGYDDDKIASLADDGVLYSKGT